MAKKEQDIHREEVGVLSQSINYLQYDVALFSSESLFSFFPVHKSFNSATSKQYQIMSLPHPHPQNFMYYCFTQPIQQSQTESSNHKKQFKITPLFSQCAQIIPLNLVITPSLKTTVLNIPHSKTTLFFRHTYSIPPSFRCFTFPIW